MSTTDAGATRQTRAARPDGSGHDRPDHDEDHHRGLAGDLSTLMERRRALKLFAGAGLITLAGCAAPSSTATTTTAPSSSTTATTGGGSPSSSAAAAATGSTVTTTGATGSAGDTASACTAIPEETAGPFPGDGSNGPDALSQSGIVRRDIRSSFGSSSTLAAGVPLRITLQVRDTAKNCAALAGAAVYLWHCDIDGQYSMYSAEVKDENYLRGVQEADANGDVTFESVFPGAYAGRWPHIHFEVYPTLAAATGAGSKLATSQLALPADTCDVVYGTAGYEQSVTNLKRTSLATDMVFRDGAAQQIPSVTGDVASGFAIALTVPV